MKPLFEDTSPRAEAVLVEGYRRMPPQQKLERVVALNRALDELAGARLQATYGTLSQEERKLRLAALHLDSELMKRVFNWDVTAKGY